MMCGRPYIDRYLFGQNLYPFEHEIKTGVPGLADQVQPALVHVPGHVVQVLHQVDPEFFLGADRREDLIRIGVNDEDRRRPVFERVDQAADHAQGAAFPLDEVNTARPRARGQLVRSVEMPVQAVNLQARGRPVGDDQLMVVTGMDVNAVGSGEFAVLFRVVGAPGQPDSVFFCDDASLREIAAE